MQRGNAFMTLMHHVSEQSDEEKYQQGFNELDDHGKFMMQSILEDLGSRVRPNGWFRRMGFGIKPAHFAITPESCEFREQLAKEGFRLSSLTCGNGATLETVARLLSLARLRGHDVSEPIEHKPCEVDGINASYIEYTLTPRVA